MPRGPADSLGLDTGLNTAKLTKQGHPCFLLIWNDTDTENTAVSADHESKSCSVYKICEDISFLEPFYFVTIFFAKSISEDI